MARNPPSGESLVNRLVIAIAPTLIIGFKERPLSGSRLMELNASPEGWTPTLLSTPSTVCFRKAMPYVITFEIDRIVNRGSVSPTL